MNGQELWNTFKTAGISDEHLKALGYELYFARKEPKGDAVVAVNKLATKLGIEPRFAYAAMNIDPGRTVLKKLADDYEKRRTWEATAITTRAYLTRIADRVKIIRGGGNGPTGGGTKTPAKAAAAASASPAAARSSATPAGASKRVWPYVVGLGVVLGGLSYVSHKGQRQIYERIGRERHTFA